MYAVIETGGKQYRVELGSEIAVDRMDLDAGSTFEFERVLLVADGDDAAIGTPVVSGATVRADVVRQDRGEKLVVFKYRPKARRRVKHGHRQDQTVLRIAEIAFNGRSAAQERDRAEAETRAARERAEQEAAARAQRDAQLAAKLAESEAATAAAAAPKPSRTRGRRAAATEPAAVEEATPEVAEPETAVGAASPVEPDLAPQDETTAADPDGTVTAPDDAVTASEETTTPADEADDASDTPSRRSRTQTKDE
jgi:large subunit ribosomal protein L21